ncbi:sensor histidine kinase [Hydrogenovibrio kuenenii]|uniref:sensor histidine kinase n=1 Tax=Hydrogenovibrio kuenenii TaxID=63658 RepID=UPI0012FF2C78|nr:hypothetical protein [Hydrogenovibrio kuenenii]
MQNSVETMMAFGLVVASVVILLLLWLVWKRRPSEALCLQAIKQLVPMFQASSLRRMEDVYIQFILQRFQPQSYQKISKPKSKVYLESSELLLPTLNGQAYYLLKPQLSGQTYTAEDLQWVEIVLYVAREVEASKQQRWLGVKEERQRIRRDLHDELTQDLIALMRSVDGDGQVQLANGAMNSLKNILSALSDEEMLLQDLLTTAQAQMRERMSLHDINLEWYEKNISSEDVVTAKVVSNVLKILKEAGCNVTKHSDTDNVKVVVNQFGHRLEVRIENEVIEKRFTEVSNQLGMKNIEARVNELHGEMNATEESGVFILSFSFPLEEGEAVGV